MIIAALKGLIMADEAPTPEEMVPSFLHAFMWASAFGVVEEARSKHLWFAGGLLIAAVTFHFVGIRWPQIKPKVGPRVASTVELIASNRLYLRAICSGIAIALLVSIPLTVYRHYHRAADKSAAPSANSSNAVQTTTPPKGPVPTESSTTPNTSTQAPAKPKHHPRSAPVQPKTTGQTAQTPSVPAPAQSQPAPPMPQECAPGAKCAMSNGQTGGFTGQQTILGTVDRELTDDQQKDLAAILKTFSGETIEVFSVNNNGESGRFAKSVQAALGMAGINAPPVVDKFIYEDIPQKPVVVYTPKGDDAFVTALAGYLLNTEKIKEPITRRFDQSTSVWIAPR